MPTALYGTAMWNIERADRDTKYNGDEVSDEYVWAMYMKQVRNEELQKRTGVMRLVQQRRVN